MLAYAQKSTAIAIFFEKMLEVHWNIGVQRDAKRLLVKKFFNILSRCLRIFL